MTKYFKNFYKYRFLLKEIVRKNIKLQYRNSVLGMFWTMLQPLLTTLVLVLVFGNIFGHSDAGVRCFPIYLLCGRLLYEFYTGATKRAMRSIRNSASVIKKVYVPKYIYPLANVLSTAVTFCISLLVLVGFLIYFIVFTDRDVELTRYILLSPLPIFVLLLLCIGVGMILCVLEVFFRDIEYIYDVFCMLLFYITPIFYSLDTLKISNRLFLKLVQLNPLYGTIQMFRDCVLFGRMLNWDTFVYTLCFSLAMILIGTFMFYKKQDKFILHI